MPRLETGHPVTIEQSPAYDFSVSDEQKAGFLVSVSDCSECKQDENSERESRYF